MNRYRRWNELLELLAARAAAAADHLATHTGAGIAPAAAKLADAGVTVVTA